MRMTFWLDVAREYGRVSLPTNTSLNCTMPALTNISVRSFWGTSDELWTSLCPRASKKSRNARRTSADVRAIEPAAIARRRRLTRYPSPRGDEQPVLRAAARALDGSLDGVFLEPSPPLVGDVGPWP